MNKRPIRITMAVGVVSWLLTSGCALLGGGGSMPSMPNLQNITPKPNGMKLTEADSGGGSQSNQIAVGYSANAATEKRDGVLLYGMYPSASDPSTR